MLKKGSEEVVTAKFSPKSHPTCQRVSFQIATEPKFRLGCDVVLNLLIASRPKGFEMLGTGGLEVADFQIIGVFDVFPCGFAAFLDGSVSVIPIFRHKSVSKLQNDWKMAFVP